MNLPGKRIKRFAKISLALGQSKILMFALDKDDFSLFGANGKPVIEAGDFTVMLDNLKETFTLK